MTEQKYHQIISALFRLCGYATGALKAIYWTENDSSITDESLDQVIKYLEDQQNLLLMKMGEKE